MKIIKNIDQMQKIVGNLKAKRKSIGFVPTMGALHEGHLSLMRKARKENDFVITSIFVNPTQFGPKEDFKKYPRNIKKDAGFCKKVGVDFIFAPEAKKMYPDGYKTYISVEGVLTEILEGKIRPGHFRGVCTIVNKLFNIVLPDRAYFGEKDYQQLMVIKKMVADLNMPVKIIGCPTLREKDGLAMSSRNAYLDKKERVKAGILNKVLKHVKAYRVQSTPKSPYTPYFRNHRTGYREKTKNAGKSTSQIRKMIEKIMKENEIKLDYVDIRDAESFEPAKNVKKGCIILLAARIGKTRLIDNVII